MGVLNEKRCKKALSEAKSQKRLRSKNMSNLSIVWTYLAPPFDGLAPLSIVWLPFRLFGFCVA